MKSYVVNRGLRIFPGLWVCFAVSLLFMFALGAIKLSQIATPPFFGYLVGQITIFQFYTPEFLRQYGVGNPNGSLWTIPVEIQFYCVLPLVYGLGKSLSSKSFDVLVGAVAILSFFSTILLHRPETTAIKLFSVTFIPHVWLFFIGVLIQRNFAKWEGLIFNKGVIWLLLFTAIRFAVMPLNNYLIETITHVILAFAVIGLAYTNRDLAHKLLKGVDISYGVYLYHMVVINVLVETGHIGPGLPVMIAIFATGLAAYLSYRFIEAPALSLKSRFRTTPKSA